MLPPFFSDFRRMSASVCFRFFDIQKDLFRPQGIGQKQPGFLTNGFWGVQKIQSYDGLSFCLSVFLSFARIMPLYTQTVLHTANPPFTKYFFYSATPRLAYSCLRFYSFSKKKPHPFCQKGWENESFF